MANVKLINVSKTYEDGHSVVKHVNINIEDKEFIVLVGPSGCGKSTTLRMIAGLEEISDGELYIDGKLMNEVQPKERDIAMVFQNYALYPHMTVFENMAFGLKLRKFNKNEIESRVNEAARILGMEAYLDRTPRALSGGQRQRVAVGRAIVRKPKVFLFDEPLSNLDTKLRVQMRTEILRLHKQLEATIIYVTHDQTEAMTMGDRIVILKDGEVQQTDMPLALYNRPANTFVAGFIGSPAMNFLPGAITREGGLAFRSADASLRIGLEGIHDRLGAADGSEVILGVRPEDLLDADPAGLRTQRVTVPLELAEPLGNEMFLHVQLAGCPLTARVASRERPEIGRELALWLNLERLHFFDARGQERL